jgi:hypothetical protein
MAYQPLPENEVQFLLRLPLELLKMRSVWRVFLVFSPVSCFSLPL